MIKTALKYIKSGLSVIPVDVNTKQPVIPWKEFQISLMPETQVNDVFNNDTGIAVVCGDVSGGLEILDFDNHQGNAKEVFKEYCNIEDVKEIIQKYNVPFEKSKSGGYHILFRSKNSGNNHKLARKLYNNKPDTIIEIRGNGGYVIIAPSKNYTLLSGDICNIPIITEHEREILLSAAMSFNEYIPAQHVTVNTSHNDGSRPGDEYDNSTECIDEAKTCLIDAGWRSTNGIHWKRPGKNHGVSATFGKVSSNVFYVFSSNAHPFDSNKGYTPYQILALTKYNGDFSECSKELYKRGYGKKNEILQVVYNKAKEAIHKGHYLSPGEINEISQKINKDYKEVEQLVKKYNKELEPEKGFASKSDIEKAEIFLRQNYDFRGDVISKLAEMRRKGTKEWIDLNVDTVFRHMQHEKIKFTIDKLKSLLKSDFVTDYNPFVDYFTNLTEWDGHDYIKQLASYIKVTNQDFFCSMFEKALVRNIACALQPEYYNRIVFTLISEKQEIGKSYFIQFLNPFGAKYYTDETLKDNKDSRFALTENFIYNLEELDQLTKMDISNLKATISTRGVKDRVPYGSHKVYYARCCSFWGSTNRDEFLVDDRNTRWLCFSINEIDREYSQKINIHDVWSQAWALYNNSNYNYELTNIEAYTRDQINEYYRVVDFETSIIQKYFEKGDYGDFMSNADIMKKMVELTDNKVKFSNNPQKLGRTLITLGFEKARKPGQRGYRIRMKDFIEEIPF
jgi:predicted P-loop ATPase